MISKTLKTVIVFALCSTLALAQTPSVPIGPSGNPGSGGGGSSPCSAFGTTAGTCAQGNDSRITGAAQLIASGAKALATSAISSGTCTAAQTASATGVLTTDAIQATFSADPTGTTGYAPTTAGMLTIIAYPTADNVNFKVCNNTAASITPGAVTLNWRVVR